MERLWLDVLVRAGRLDADDARDALEEAERLGVGVDTVLLLRDRIDEASLLEAFRQAHGHEVASRAISADPAALRALPEPWALRHRLAPLAWDRERGTLTVLSRAPADLPLLAKLGAELGLELVPILAPEARVEQRLEQLYGRPPSGGVAPLLERWQERRELRARIQSAKELPPMPAPATSVLDSAIARLAATEDRDAIVHELLDHARREVDFAAFFAVADGYAAGWAAVGAGHENIARVTVQDPRSAFTATVHSAIHHLGPLSPVDHHALAPLERAAPKSALVIPIRVRDRVVALLYAENGARSIPPRAASDLILLASYAGQALERLVLRRKARSRGDSVIGRALMAAAPTTGEHATGDLASSASEPHRAASRHVDATPIGGRRVAPLTGDLPHATDDLGATGPIPTLRPTGSQGGDDRTGQIPTSAALARVALRRVESRQGSRVHSPDEPTPEPRARARAALERAPRTSEEPRTAEILASEFARTSWGEAVLLGKRASMLPGPRLEGQTGDLAAQSRASVLATAAPSEVEPAGARTTGAEPDMHAAISALEADARARRPSLVDTASTAPDAPSAPRDAPSPSVEAALRPSDIALRPNEPLARRAPSVDPDATIAPEQEIQSAAVRSILGLETRRPLPREASAPARVVLGLDPMPDATLVPQARVATADEGLPDPRAFDTLTRFADAPDASAREHTAIEPRVEHRDFGPVDAASEGAEAGALEAGDGLVRTAYAHVQTAAEHALAARLAIDEDDTRLEPDAGRTSVDAAWWAGPPSSAAALLGAVGLPSATPSDVDSSLAEQPPPSATRSDRPRVSDLDVDAGPLLAGPVDEFPPPIDVDEVPALLDDTASLPRWTRSARAARRRAPLDTLPPVHAYRTHDDATPVEPPPGDTARASVVGADPRPVHAIDASDDGSESADASAADTIRRPLTAEERAALEAAEREDEPFGDDTLPMKAALVDAPARGDDETPARTSVGAEDAARADLGPEPAEPPEPVITAPDTARAVDEPARAAITAPDTPRAALVEVEVTRALDDDVDAMLDDVFGGETRLERLARRPVELAAPPARAELEAPMPLADRAALAAIERAATAATERMAELERQRREEQALEPDPQASPRASISRAVTPFDEARRDPPRARSSSTIQPWQVPSEGALSVPPLASDPPPPSRPSLSFIGRAPVPSPRRDRTAWTSHVEAAFAAWSSLPMSSHGDLESELRHLASGGAPPVAALRREAWVRASSRSSRPGAPHEPEVELREPPSAPVPPPSLAPEGAPTPRASATQSVQRGPHPLPFEEAQSLLDALEGSEPARRALAREVILARADELRPFLVRRFPGRVTVDPFEEGRAPPAFAASGELLSVFAELGARFSPEVAERLDDPLPLVRYFALLAFTVYPASPQMPRIVRRLHDEEPELRALALEIIRRQRGTPAMAGVLDHLRQRLESPSPFARRQAAKLVGAIQDREVVPLLLPLLERKDRGVADAAQEALTELAKQRLGPGSARWGEWWRAHREASCVTWLLAALDGSEPVLRRAAADALVRETGLDAGFDADAPRRARDDAKRRWVDWWVAERSRRPGAGNDAAS